MWFLDLLRVITADEDPLTVVEREGAGAESGYSSEEDDNEVEEKASTKEKKTKASKSSEPEERKPKRNEPIENEQHLEATTGVPPGGNGGSGGFINSILDCCQCLGTCCLITYVLCPPLPCCIVRKVAFRPPPRGQSYRMVVTDDNGERKYVSKAKEAAKYPKLQIEPLWTDKHPANEHLVAIIRRELKSVDGFIVKSKSGNSIVCAHFKARPIGYKTPKCFRNKVAIFAQPNSSDIGGFMQPFLPASLHNFAQAIGIDIYAFDYSGFGRSNGSSYEKNIYGDIRSVYEEVIKREGESIQILLIGYSIGTAATVDLASKKPSNLFGLVLMAPFTSGMRLLTNNPRKESTACLDCFTNYDKIPLVEVPVLVCHGTADTITPLSHGQVLFERSKYKIDPVIVEGASHVSIMNGRHKYVQMAIRYFITTQKLERRSPLFNL